MIETKQVKDRRKLSFDSLADAVREADSLAAADAAGKLRSTGNWTPGQAIAHVAYWAELPFEGYPESVRPPWFIRLVMRLMRGRMLRDGMMAGVRIPGVEGGTLGADDMPTAAAAERLREAFDRLDQQCPADPNPLFGKMNHDQWRGLNLRHAELHFSFFHPE